MRYAPNPFTHAIRNGQKQIGLWVGLTSNFATDVVAGAGYDWVVVDMEHSPNDITSTLGQLQSFEACKTTALVRPDWNDPVKVKRILDIGASGLVFPMIQSVMEAEMAVAACRYPPHGIRGVSGSTRANAFGRITDYTDRVEDEITIIVQLETRAAIAQAEKIAAVDGVDGVFFGPADIAADLGKLGNPMDPAVCDLIWSAAHKLIAKNIPVGTLVLDATFASKLLNDGFTFVACGMDTSILAQGADNLLANVKGKITQ